MEKRPAAPRCGLAAVAALALWLACGWCRAGAMEPAEGRIAAQSGGKLADAPLDRVILHFRGIHVMVVGQESKAARVELPGLIGGFQAMANGRFLYRNDPDRHSVTGFLAGDLRDPKRLAGVKCPAEAGELLNAWRLSNKGDRIAWCFFNSKRKAGRLVVSDASTGRVEYEMEKPFVGDAGLAFGEPAWSPDDRRLPLLHLQSSGVEDDPKPMAMLLGVDLAKRQAKAMLPEPFDLYVPTSHRLRFSPDGGEVMFPMDEPAPSLDIWPHIVGFDGRGLRPAQDVVFLADGRHVVVDLKREGGADGDVMTGILRDVTTGKAERLRFPASPRGGAWSVDGRWQAQSEMLPWKNGDESNWSIITAVNTRTGERHELTRIMGGIDARQLSWVRY